MYSRLKVSLFKVSLVLSGVVLLVGLATAGMALWVKDRIRTTDYCAGCHVIRPYYDTWKLSTFTAHTHAAAGVVCQDCHRRTVGEQLREFVSNVTRSHQFPLNDYHVNSKVCFRCHGSYQVLADLTKNLIGPDGFPLGRNPHHSHWGALDCAVCHKMHSASVDFCSKCHGLPVKGPAWADMASLLLRTPRQPE